MGSENYMTEANNIGPAHRSNASGIEHGSGLRSGGDTKNNTGLRSQNANITNSSPTRGSGYKTSSASPFGERASNTNTLNVSIDSPGRWNKFNTSPRRRNDTPSASAARVGSPFAKPTLSFTIFEDKVAPHRDVNEMPPTNKLNHNDQENILQPKKTTFNAISRMSSEGIRRPLANLSMKDFPGYVGGVTLTELYQPPNFENDFKSIHKFLGFPNYVSPVKKDHYLVKTDAEGVFSGFKNEAFNFNNTSNDVFDLQNPPSTPTKRLVKSSLTTHIIRKHHRSLSVGKNDSKLKLIRKNNFSILSS